MIKFAAPLWLWCALIGVPALIGLFLWSARRSRARLAGIVAERLREQMLSSVHFKKRRIKGLLIVSGITLLLIALARPLAGFLPMQVERSSVDFFVALDLSRSMLAEDADGQRLKAAKGAVGRLLTNLSNDRVGLIAFAGEAFVAAPMTQDHEAVRRNLDALETTSIAKAGSDIAVAIKLAQKTFENGEYESKALVIISDGEELQGDAIIAAREAAGKGIRIFTIGAGSAAGTRIPDAKQGGPLKFAKNEFGREVITRLNERVLQQIAASGQGFYEPLGKEGDGLLSTYRRGLEPLSKGMKTRPSRDMIDYFQWPLGLAIALLLGEMLLSDRRRPKLLPAKALVRAVPRPAPVLQP
ncbi:MAG: Mg-chelatase subunit ChlD [Chthoniobacteraceae bacterium]|nr:Mg-chelatase subunit ChlD [Chthoniobacteraceae bacterium]